MRLFPYAFPVSIGFDLGERSLKVAALKTKTTWSGKQIYTIVALEEFPVPPGVTERGSIVDDKALAQFFSATMHTLRNTIKGILEVTIGIPESQSFLLTVPASGVDVHDVEAYIAKEVPFPIEELMIDSQVIGPRRIIGATPRSSIDRVVAAAEAAGLTVAAIDFEGLSTIRAVHRALGSNPTMTWGLIDFGATRTQCMIAEGEMVLRTLRLPLAGEEITATIAKTLHLSTEQSEHTKRECGIDPDRCHGSLKEILIPQYQLLVTRIKEIIAAAYDNATESVAHIALVGGGASMPGLVQFLNAALNMKTEIPPLLASFTSASGHHATDPKLGFATALGLALRGAYAASV